MAERATLTTERLTLRHRSVAEVDDLVAMDCDEEVVQFILDGVASDAARHRRDLIERIIADDNPVFGYWSVFDRGPHGAFLGWVCLVPTPDHDFVEIGWRFNRASWGKGYATEAARVVLRYGVEVADLARIVALVKPENTRSLRVIDKLGLKPEGTCFAYGEDLARYGLTRPKG